MAAMSHDDLRPDAEDRTSVWGVDGGARRPASAPDVLLSVLGEYVVLGAGGAWQEALVAAIKLFGHSTAAARQATARAVREGALIARREGRRSWLQLSDDAARTLREAAAIAAGPSSLSTGLWNVFIIRGEGMGEGRPRLHQRTQLLLGGLGNLGEDVWIAPDGPGSAMVQQALADDPSVSLVTLRSEIAFPDAREVVDRAWNLDEIRECYARLVADFADRAPESDIECFVAWTELQRRWRASVRQDPGLPAATLPQPWPRDEAERLVAARRQQWRSRAVDAFERLGAHLPLPPT